MVFPLIVKFCRKEPICVFLWGTWHWPPLPFGKTFFKNSFTQTKFWTIRTIQTH